MGDFFSVIFNLDNQLFRTLGALFIPGKLTTVFFQGKYQRYLTPIRIFFITAVLHFAALNYAGGLEWNIWNGATQLKSRVQKQAAMAEAADRMELYKDSLIRWFAGIPAEPVVDSLKKALGNTHRDTIDLPISLVGQVRDSANQVVKFDSYDLISLPPDSLLTMYHITDWWQQLNARQTFRLIQNPENFTAFVLGKFVWMVFLMMPLLALILKLLYIRRPWYYVEHLVFSFHYHAFAFLLAGLSFLTRSPFVVGSAFFLIYVYLYIAMLRVYKQGYIKTFLKHSFLNFSYIFVFVIFIGLTFIISAALY